MFRKKSLDKMMHPDSLDQLLVVVTPQAQLTLATLALVLVIGIVWSFVAQIPVTVDGQGILLKPRSLKTIQAPGSGLLTELRVAVGQNVAAGDVIATIEQAELERQLEQEVAKYRAVREFNDQALELALRKQIVGGDMLPEPKSSTIRQLQDRLTARIVELNKAQTENLEKTRSTLLALRDSQRQQLANVTDLVSKGIASVSQQLNAQGALNDIESRLADIDVRIRQNAMNRLDAEQSGLRRTQEMETQESQLAANIRIIKERLHRQAQVRAQFAGRILEVGSSVGQMLSTGQRVFIMQIEAQEPFYRVEFGRDAARGSFALVVGDATTAPLPLDAGSDTVRDALRPLDPVKDYTVMVTRAAGTNGFDILFHPDHPGLPARPRLEVRDSKLADAQGVPSFATIFELGDKVAAEDLKHLGFFPIGLGKRVQPGMEVRINPSNVERQRYGSIVGRVTKVSEFPVTAEGVVNMIGNTDVAQTLLARGGAMLIEAEMEKDPSSPTGLQWTSSGPPQPMTPGTTTTCRVTLEKRAPITFALPLLRGWLLGEADNPVPAR